MLVCYSEQESDTCNNRTDGRRMNLRHDLGVKSLGFAEGLTYTSCVTECNVGLFTESWKIGCCEGWGGAGVSGDKGLF